jgi:hypothetical protein
MTNEERFIASCATAGEAEVRQKLNANRYSGRKVVWAGDWLEMIESAKTEATKAEERSSGLRVAARNSRQSAFGLVTILIVTLLAGAALLLMVR